AASAKVPSAHAASVRACLRHLEFSHECAIIRLDHSENDESFRKSFMNDQSRPRRESLPPSVGGQATEGPPGPADVRRSRAPTPTRLPRDEAARGEDPRD